MVSMKGIWGQRQLVNTILATVVSFLLVLPAMSVVDMQQFAQTRQLTKSFVDKSTATSMNAFESAVQSRNEPVSDELQGLLLKLANRLEASIPRASSRLQDWSVSLGLSDVELVAFKDIYIPLKAQHLLHMERLDQTQ